MDSAGAVNNNKVKTKKKKWSGGAVPAAQVTREDSISADEESEEIPEFREAEKRKERKKK